MEFLINFWALKKILFYCWFLSNRIVYFPWLTPRSDNVKETFISLKIKPSKCQDFGSGIQYVLVHLYLISYNDIDVSESKKEHVYAHGVQFKPHNKNSKFFYINLEKLFNGRFHISCNVPFFPFSHDHLLLFYYISIEIAFKN